jgi:recombination protein RecA
MQVRILPTAFMNTDQIIEVLKAPRRREPVAENYLSTGSTLLNLALSGRADGGIPAGKYAYFVGDSSSGKTFLALTALAEAQLSEHFKGHRIIFDNAEDGALMDFNRYFGPTVASKLEPARVDKDGDPQPSSTIEEFYFNLDDALDKAEKGKPFIYVLDSMDSLSSDYEGKKFDEAKTASRKGKDAKGSYGDGKAKTNSTYLRRAVARIRDTGSVLIIISQTRDNIDAGMFEPSKTRSGGHALKFYAAVEIWSSVAGKLKKTVHGKDRQIGIVAKLSVKKNRITGKEWSVAVPLYWSTGIDDVGSCVDYLVDEKQWKKDGSGQIDGSGDFKGCVGYREQVIKYVEDSELEDDLRELTADVWKMVEVACTVERKQRYE